MATVGERLRQAREHAGLTLSDVAARTKIKLWILEDIERDDFSRVPGGVFARGYLTSFGRVVGIDPEPLWTEYRAATQVVEPVVVVEPRRFSLLSGWTVLPVIGIVIVAAALWWMNAPRKKADPVPVATAVPVAPPSQPAREVVPVAATSGSKAEAAVGIDTHQRDSKTAPLVVQVHATNECWIDARVDGEQKVYRTLTPGEELRLEGVKEIRLLVGDAAAVTYSINGKPGRRLGAPGIVRQIVVPATGYESLIESAAG